MTTIPNVSQHALNVIYLVSSYPRGPEDPSAVFLHYLTSELHRQGLTVHVLAPAEGCTEVVTQDGVKVHRFQYFPRRWQRLAYGSGVLPNLRRNPWLWLQVPFFAIAMMIRLLTLARRLNPDIVHAHWILPQGLIAALTRPFHSARVIVTAHGGDAFGLQARIWRYLKRYAIQRSHAWTANTRATARALGPGPIPAARIIPMGIDIRLFSSGKRIKHRKQLQHEKVVLFVGRLVEKKGVDDLITAFAQLPLHVRRKAALWIIGDGEQREMLAKLAAHLGVSSHVKFWGKIANRDLPDFYAAADLFVGPSVLSETGDTEGLGVVFLEAFAAGLCVLATRVGGIGEVIEHGKTGYLVDPRQPAMLSEAMTLLLQDDARRKELANNASIQVRQHYSWEHIAAQFSALYRHTLAE